MGEAPAAENPGLGPYQYPQGDEDQDAEIDGAEITPDDPEPLALGNVGAVDVEPPLRPVGDRESEAHQDPGVKPEPLDVGVTFDGCREVLLGVAGRAFQPVPGQPDRHHGGLVMHEILPASAPTLNPAPRQDVLGDLREQPGNRRTDDEHG